MKHFRIVLLLLCTGALLASGCAGKLGGKETRLSSPPNAAVEMQEKNIAMITNYLKTMEGQAAELGELQKSDDPVMMEIYANDLAGVNLKIELLGLLLDHCKDIREKLLEAQANPARKKEILAEFRQERKALMLQVDAIDLQQDQQERRRMELGQKLVEKALQ